MEGQSIPINENDNILILLGYLNTTLIRFILNRYCGQHKTSGYLNLLPYSNFSDSQTIAKKVKEAIITRMNAEKMDEISSLYIGLIPNIKKIKDFSTILNELSRTAIEKMISCEENCENALEEIFNLDDNDKNIILNFKKNQPEIKLPISDINSINDFIWFSSHSVISYLLGTTLGRWDIRFATGVKEAPTLPDPFDPLPVCPPGMLQNDDGLPAEPNDVPKSYPLRISWQGILVDDEGHKEDIVARVREAMEVIWKENAGDIEEEACGILGIRSLREYFAKPGSFFADHLKRYSKSRRQAPIYWPLSTASGSYTLWLYYHRLDDQILYTCVIDFVEPKLKQTAASASALRQKKNRSTTEEKDLERLTTLELELKDFRDELLRVAAFWRPNLNDGVQITASPLWQLFKLSKWQKTLKETWQKLEKGDYDWAHLAYSIWPDRVKKKCVTDKSLAIAHGLEELYKETPKAAKKGKAKKIVAEEVEDDDDDAGDVQGELL